MSIPRKRTTKQIRDDARDVCMPHVRYVHYNMDGTSAWAMLGSLEVYVDYGPSNTRMVQVLDKEGDLDLSALFDPHVLAELGDIVIEQAEKLRARKGKGATG